MLSNKKEDAFGPRFSRDGWDEEDETRFLQDLPTPKHKNPPPDLNVTKLNDLDDLDLSGLGVDEDELDDEFDSLTDINGLDGFDDF